MPSALKIADSTCCEFSPSIRRTWIVSPAASASSSRNVAARSLCSPPARVDVRSAFETTSGRPDASTTTMASASSAGAIPNPRRHRSVSERSGAERLAERLPASPTSASGSSGAISSRSRSHRRGPAPRGDGRGPRRRSRPRSAPPARSMRRGPALVTARCARSTRRARAVARRCARSRGRSGGCSRSSTSPRRTAQR